MTQRCGNPSWSCILIIGVISNSPTVNQSSTYMLTLMDNKEVIQSPSLFTQTINVTTNYWFIQPKTNAWSYIVSLKALQGSGNIYVSVINGTIPNSNSYEYMSNRLTTDIMVIDSTDPIFQVYNRVPNILIVISIVPFT